MKQIVCFSKLLPVIFFCLGIISCTSIPKGILKPSEDSLRKKQLQTRQYDTTDEKQILTAVAGVLQDLSFTLDESETQLGLVSASKKADAKSGGQIAGAVMLDLLAGSQGSYSNYTGQCDKSQCLKASVIVKPSFDGKKTIVRVTFQRIVWNMNDQISKLETIDEPEVYQKFFESLSKAIFLEGQKI